MQLGIGDINVTQTDDQGMVGYSPQHPIVLDRGVKQHCEQVLLSQFPTEDPEVDRELGRLLAMLQAEDDAWPTRILAQCTEQSHVEDDLHYLMVLAHLKGRRSAQDAEQTATALVGLHSKMMEGEKYASRNWPRHVSDMFERLCTLDRQLPQALVEHPDFGLPQHSLFALLVPSEYRTRSAERLLARINDDLVDDSEWTPELVRVIASLPNDQSLDLLRQQWLDFRLRDAIVVVLAKDPKELDRSRFVDSLQSARPSTVNIAAAALCSLPARATPEQLAAALSVLKRHCADAQYAKTRHALSNLLHHWTQQEISISEQGTSIDDLAATYQPWFDWFEQLYPEQSQRFRGLAGLAEWKNRFNEMDWTTGDVERGRIVFQRLQCAACHTGNRRLGPDLQPIARRFSRDDLFASIIEPNQNVSPTYQTKRFVTASGRVFSGMVVYESPNGTLLQTGPDETIRIADDEIVEVTSSPNSLMPNDLLREATDQDLTDLYSYLQQLAKQ
jgi:putative heme-binding domain-containing protein